MSPEDKTESEHILAEMQTLRGADGVVPAELRPEWDRLFAARQAVRSKYLYVLGWDAGQSHLSLTGEMIRRDNA